MTNTDRAIKIRNAYNFIISAFEIDKTIDDIMNLDYNSLLEFADDNNTTPHYIIDACKNFES